MSKRKFVSPEEIREDSHSGLNLLYLFIVVIVIGGLLATSIFLAKSDSFTSVEMEDIVDVDHELVKVLLSEGEIGTQEFRVMNIAEGSENIEVSSNMGDLLSFSESSFSLDSGQTKVLDLSFNSIIESSGVEYQVGVYSGNINIAANGDMLSVPVVVDIESEEVLFDSSFELTRDSFDAGESFNLPIRVFNLVNQDATNVLLEYFVKDINGNVVFSGEETVLVDTQLSTTKTISLSSNLNPGDYILGVSITYGDSTGVSSSVISVGEQVKENKFFEGNQFFTILSGILLVFFLFFVSILIYKFIKKDSVKEEKNKYMNKEVVPLFDRSLLIYLFIAVALFIGILFVIFFAGFLSYAGLLEILFMIPSSVYVVFLVLLIIFVVLLILRSMQNLKTRYYHHEVDRLKKQMEIEKYKKNLVGLQEEAREAKEGVKKKRFEEGRLYSILRALHLTKSKEELAVIKRKEKLKIKERLEEEKRFEREQLKQKKEIERIRKANEREKLDEIKRFRLEEENKIKEAEKKREEAQKKKEESVKVRAERRKSISNFFNFIPNKLNERKELKKQKKLDKADIEIQKLHEKENKKDLFKSKESKSPELKEVEQLPELEELKAPIELPVEEYHVELKEIDPWIKVNDLLKTCYHAISNKNLARVELNYNQIKPLFLKLERWQKQKVYPKLNDIQNEMAMLEMSKLRKGLRKKKK
ncbi:hypothetical protein HN681_01770 [archaeon]|nr:hypothetical protein [archaeon]MBT3730549.1 hypothetical protein [archaeon]MBT4669385.1 hypothetical protein [archaeon]MBT5029862.1 hypothetical protein [archaeon]MBT5288075.1 hypothetical protein [archaeon]